MSSESACDVACPSGRGLLLIVSGPSGSGKSTLVDELIRQKEFPIMFSVSATSRHPRRGEVDGKHYHFLDRERFEALRRDGEFLEHAEVHGNLYGTPRQFVEKALSEGKWVIMEIDVQGHEQVKKVMPEAISFFVRTLSWGVNEERLRKRNTDSQESILRRRENASQELSGAASYDFQIVNESLPQAVRTFLTLLRGLKAQAKDER